MRKVGFNDGDDRETPVPGGSVSRRKVRQMIGLVVIAALMEGFGIALLIISAQRGEILGIAFAMVWLVALTTMVVTTLIRQVARTRGRLRSDRHVWRDDRPDT